MNFARYHATFEKLKAEAVADAEAILRAKDEDKKFFGDENCAKVRRHDGSVYYYISEEVLKEMLFWKAKQEAALKCVIFSDSASKLSKKEFSALEYVASFEVNRELFSSLKKAFNGSFMMDFYRDKEAVAELEAISEAKKELYATRWGF